MTTQIKYRSINTTEGHMFHVVEIPGQAVKPHSINHPAITYSDGTKEYYIYGLKYNYQDWLKAIANYKTIKKTSTNANEQ